MNNNRQRLGLSLLILFISTAVYWLSVTPGPSGYADADELSATSFLMGVAHPPGYALMTFKTHGLMKIFTWLDPALVGNLISGFLQAFALMLFFNVLMELFGVIRLNQKLATAAALTATGLLGFSFLYWLYGTIFEVGPLTNVLFLLSLWFSLKWWSQPVKRSPFSWWFIGCSLSLGLLLAHYQPAVLILPGFLVFLIYGLRDKQVSLRHSLYIVAGGLIFLALAFTLTQLPLLMQNSRQSAVSWYFPPSIQGFLNHLVRTELSTYSFEHGRSFAVLNLSVLNPGKLAAALGLYFNQLNEHLGWWSLLLALWGVIISWRKKWRFALPFMLMWFISGPLFGMYLNAVDLGLQKHLVMGVIQRQYFLGELTLMLFAGLGLASVFDNLKTRFPKYHRLVIFIALILVGGQAFYNISVYRDRTNRTLVAGYANQVLSEADPGSVIICTTDIDCYGLLYASEVKGVRPDVTVLPSVSTYRVYYLKSQPKLYPYTDFGEPDFLPNLIAWNVSKRPVYLTQGINQYTGYIGLETGPFFLVPEGNLFRVTTAYPNLKTPEEVITPSASIDRRDYYGLGIKEFFGNLEAYRGYLALRYNQRDLAYQYLMRALKLDSGNPQTAEMVHRLEDLSYELKVPDSIKTIKGYESDGDEFLKNGDLQNAELSYRHAGYLEPLNKDILNKLIKLYLEAGDQRRATLTQTHLQTIENLGGK